MGEQVRKPQSKAPSHHPRNSMGNDIGLRWWEVGGDAEVHDTLPCCNPERALKVDSTISPTHMRPSCKEKKSKANTQELPQPIIRQPAACSLHTCASSYRVPWKGWPGGLWWLGTTSYLFLFIPFLRPRMTGYFFGG